MQDRPSYEELLAALERFLDEEIVPNVEGARSFHARVAANVVRMVRRELSLQEADLDCEWSGLDELLGQVARPQSVDALNKSLLERNEDLCARIRLGDADSRDWASEVRAHVRNTVRNKLRVSDPALLERDESS